MKNKTRKGRSKTIEYLLYPEIKLTMSVKDLLSSSKTKRNLTKMFAEALLKHFSTNDVRVFVIYDTKIVGPDISVEHTHEKADTLIPNQVLAAAAEDNIKDITVRSTDTDVLILLMDLVANDLIDDGTSLQFHTGKGKCSYNCEGAGCSPRVWHLLDSTTSLVLTGVENLWGKLRIAGQRHL